MPLYRTWASDGDSRLTRKDRELAELLGPVRDICVGELLRELSNALEQGSDVQSEPMLRDAEIRIVRSGALHLPRRGDLKVRQGVRSVIRKVPVRRSLLFDPLTVVRSDGFVAIIAPFSWDSARLIAHGSGAGLSWTPLRRWFLEAFQSRYSDLSPDLDGAIHSISGPRNVAEGCEFEIDFGSAPVEAFSEMLDAFAQSGADRVVVGSLNPSDRHPIDAD